MMSGRKSDRQGRNRYRGRSRVWSAGICAWWVVSPSAAETATTAVVAEPIRVLSTADSCVSAEAFHALLAQRNPLVRHANATEPAKQFVVSVTPGVEAKGDLQIVGLDGSESSRTVFGQTCDEVADALALVGALSIDPLALRAHQPPADATRTLEPTPTTSPTRTETKPRSKIWIRAANVVPSNRQSALEAKAGSRRIEHAVSAETFALVGSVGSPWIGVSGKYWLGPGVAGLGQIPLRLSAGLSRTLWAKDPVRSEPATGMLDYTLTSVDLGLCPVGLRPVQTVRLLGCAFGNLGWLQVEHARVSPPERKAGPFFALVLASRFEAQIRGSLGVTAAFGVSVPVTQYRVHVDSVAGAPEVPLPSVTILGALGLNLSRW
jgi:hypothetical protein